MTMLTAGGVMKCECSQGAFPRPPGPSTLQSVYYKLDRQVFRENKFPPEPRRIICPGWALFSVRPPPGAALRPPHGPQSCAEARGLAGVVEQGRAPHLVAQS